MLNLRDQERHPIAPLEKLALSQGSINYLLYCPPHSPPSQGSLTWVFSGYLAPAQQWHPLFMTTPTVVPRRNHVRTRMNPHPYPELNRKSTWNRPPPNTRVTTLQPFVMGSGHPSKCWPYSLLLKLRDQETLYRIARKACSLARQYVPSYTVRHPNNNKLSSYLMSYRDAYVISFSYCNLFQE
jgi:hypothetical protein